MLRLEESRDGDRTARFNETLLHSRYAPRKEARRFIATSRNARCYLVLGAGLGYLAEALSQRFPHSSICSLHPSRELAEAASWSPGLHAAPSEPRELAPLLERAFGPEALYGFELIFWEAGRSAAAEWADAIEAGLLQLARRNHDSLLSTGYFGYSWLANGVTNLVDRWPERGNRTMDLDGYPVLLAPGPTAEYSLHWIRAHRNRIALVAVSSAAPLLQAAGLRPDLIIHTDGGYWATLHLQRQSGSPIAAAIKARIPVRARESVTLFLPDPTSPVEMALSTASALPLLPIPGHGTVTGTATRLIARLFSAPPLLLGLDLASHGYRGHARPHAFDTMHFSSTNRLRPLETLLRDRLREPRLLEPPWMAPRDLETYAASFQEELSGRGALRMCPSPLPLPTEVVSEQWSPPTSPKADLSKLQRPGRGESIRETLLSWKVEITTVKPSELVSPLRSTAASVACLEELCRLLALPELLRLRSASDAGEETHAHFDALQDRVTERLTRLLTKAEQ